MDNRREWIEPDHPILSVRQQAEILGINRSVIYYEPRLKVFSEEQLKLLRLVDIYKVSIYGLKTNEQLYFKPSSSM